MEGLSPFLAFQVEPGLIAVLCELSTCFIKTRERKREAFLTIPGVPSHRCCHSLFIRSQSLGPDRAKGEWNLKSVITRKWRSLGALLGISSFVKMRHVWTRHIIRSSKMCIDGKEGAITVQAMNFPFSQMLLFLAVVKQTKKTWRSQNVCSTAQVSQPWPHSSVILNDTTIIIKK